MLMLYNSGKRYFPLRIVYYGVSLIVVCIKSFILKIHSSVFKYSELVIKELVNHSGIYGFIGYVRIFLYEIFVLRICSYLNTVKQLFYNTCISAYRYTLISVIKVVVIKGKSQRKSFYNKCRKLLCVSAPLLFGISLYKLFIYIFSYQRYSLLFQVFRIIYT